MHIYSVFLIQVKQLFSKLNFNVKILCFVLFFLVQSQTAPFQHLTYPFYSNSAPFTHPSVSPSPSLSLCVSLSLRVSDRVCYMSRLPACSVPTSPSSGDVVSSPLSAGNRRVRSPPRGAGVGREGEEREETSRFFFFSSLYSKVRVIQKYVHIHAHIDTHGHKLVRTHSV